MKYAKFMCAACGGRFTDEDEARNCYDTCRNKSADVVNSPEHYRQGGIEAIDAIAAATAELRGIEAVCTANAIKYLWRWKRKNGIEDLRKSKWYLERLIAEVGGD